MLELIIRLLPLIFLSCAIGIVLLNIQAIFSYIIYVLSMAIQPKELFQASQQLESRNNSGTKFTLFTPFIRVWTLFRVLFFPDLDISGIIQRHPEDPQAWMSSAYVEKTQQEFAGVRIKSYSVAGSDTSHFRNALDPMMKPHVSSEFAKTFPTLLKETTNQPSESLPIHAVITQQKTLPSEVTPTNKTVETKGAIKRL